MAAFSVIPKAKISRTQGEHRLVVSQVEYFEVFFFGYRHLNMAHACLYTFFYETFPVLRKSFCRLKGRKMGMIKYTGGAAAAIELPLHISMAWQIPSQ